MMVDEFDLASEKEYAERERLIEQARKPIKKLFTGYCDYCNERISDGRRFCSPECRDDYEMEEAAMKRHRGRY